MAMKTSTHQIPYSPNFRITGSVEAALLKYIPLTAP
jgi:hypothetical protein